MKEVMVFGGAVSLVDDDDFAEISKYKWYLTSKGYAATQVYEKGRKTSLRMHRHIFGASHEDPDIDHINMNKLDNRKENLRFCSASQNNSNRGVQRNNKVGIKGVSFHKKVGRWRAQIGLDGKMIHIGFYDTPEGAGMAYSESARKYHGDFSRVVE